MATVYVIGTADTKSDELNYAKGLIEAQGVSCRLVDVGTQSDGSTADVTPHEVAALHPDGPDAVFLDDRGAAVSAMADALVLWIARQDDVDGILGMGGSGGTNLVTPAMRSLPVGVPKMMVSTVASADVSPYVGPADIAMMYSVTDVAGINRISSVVLANAAHAIAGMAANRIEALTDAKPAVGMTMFGVTTPLVLALVDALEDTYDPLVFHATGTGGQSMEKLIDSGMVDAILDMTTTEVADHVVGGVFSAGPNRFEASARSGLPYVGSVGALDMVNFHARDTVPPAFDGRQFHIHNANVTLMRTTVEENVAFGEFIAEKLNSFVGPVRFLLPEGGLSMIDAPGQPFDGPEQRDALYATIEAKVETSDQRQVIRVPHHINDPEFVETVLTHFTAIAGRDS
jgi:uncharacterized protein (UPF0261 family)